MRDLTQKEEMFCREYIKTGCATEAYRRSYSAGNMKNNTVNRRAYDITLRPHVKKRINELNEQATVGAVMSRRKALETLSAIASTGVTDIVDFETITSEVDGEEVTRTVWRVKESADLSKSAGLAIKSVTMTANGPRIDLHDKLTALQQLARLQGWEASQKFDHVSSDGSMTPNAGGVSVDIIAALKAKDKDNDS